MTTPPPATLAQLSAPVRAAKKQIRRDIRTGALPIGEVLADPPTELHGELLTNVLLLAPQFGHGRLEVLGRLAAKDGVSLTVTLGRASVETRRWVADRLARGLAVTALSFIERREMCRADDDTTAAELLDAIREHRRMVSSTSAAAEDFARADSWLWETAERIAARAAA